MEATKTYQLIAENNFMWFAQDDDYYHQEKENIADAFYKLEDSADSGTIEMDTVSTIRRIVANYVALLNTTHNMIEIKTDGQQDEG